ncbi:DUF4262 domain-containing protein [Actinomycetospora atypica]|uniref:DUF4262 domain-containing protein n=1 Tax=Actinomycetospora atypica TaxID=1290095 RepID=A0ABV9YGU5_9PSEU
MCEGWTRAEALREMEALVERYGWAIQHVWPDAVHSRWAYTVGLTRYGLPELVVTGMEQEAAHELLNDTAHGGACHDDRTVPGQRYSLDDGRRIEVVELSHPDVHLGTAVALHPGRVVRAHQLVWADDCGRWPWSRRFCGPQGAQPVLGPRAVRGA